MKGMKWMLAGAAVAAALLMAASGTILAVRAQDAGAKQPGYTMPEYNAYKACADEKAAQARVKCLDDFVLKFQNPAILVYAYTLYYQSYAELRTFPKVIENVDKLLALGDRADLGMRHLALYNRALAFNNIPWDEKKPETKDQAVKARDAALLGLKTLGEIKKPDNMSQEDFDKQTQGPKIVFNYTAANAARIAKDFKAAVDSYRATLVLTPNEPATWSQLGISYLSMTPPAYLDGFWVLGHAVALKGPTEAQLRKYLRSQVGNYQGQSVCDSLLDAEINELVTLAGSSTERPESYKLPSAADLDAARKEMTIASVIADLKAGGGKSKVTWLAACGLEFPEVPSKVIEVVPGDVVTLKVAFVTSEEEFNAATTPNMEVKVIGQPEAARIQKNDPVHFTGTLQSFDPDPAFMLRWDKAKVNAEDIPEEKKQPAKKAVRPGRRAPAKKPPA